MSPGLLALWVGQLAAPLHGRNPWRMARLVVGILLAQGRRTVTSRLRATGITHGYRSYYYFLDALGHKAQAVGLIPLRLSIARLAIGDRLTLALDDTPTKRHGPKVQGAGRHYNPTPGPAGPRALYGHNRVVLARLVRHRLSGIIGLPLWAALYVRRRDVPRLPARAGWSFRTELELAGAMIGATAATSRGVWSGPTWLLTDGGYARRPIFRAARGAGWHLVTRLRRDAHLNDLPPPVPPGRRPPGRPRIYGAKRLNPAKRAGQTRGRTTVVVRASTGEVQTWMIKSFLATWRPAGGVVRVLIVKDESGLRAYACTEPGASPREVAQAIADRWGSSRSSTTSRRTSGSARFSRAGCGRTSGRSTWACGSTARWSCGPGGATRGRCWTAGQPVGHAAASAIARGQAQGVTARADGGTVSSLWCPGTRDAETPWPVPGPGQTRGLTTTPLAECSV